jgi:flagellar hook-associated protein 1 FlgK
MASLFTGLNIARSGLMASQTALDITSQNISNADTPGYSRQTLNLTSAGPNTGGYRLLYNSDMVGNGVNYVNVSQSRDSFLDVRYRNANSENSDWQAQSDNLSSVEDIFNEFSGSGDDAVGLSGQMSSLLTSLQEYQTTPTDDTLPTTIKSSVDTIAFTVKNDYSNLEDLQSQIQSDLAITINGDNTGGGVDAMLNNVADLNQQIASFELTGRTANDLRDQRNLVLDKLSGYLDINVSEQQNGMVTVGLASDPSHMLVGADNTVTGLTLNTAQDAVYWDDGKPQTDANKATIKGGSVDASLQVLNGDGTGTGDYGGVGITYLKQKLNDFATNFDQMINGFASEYKYPDAAYPTTANPNPATTPDTVDSALVYYDPSKDPASTLSVSPGWQSNDELFAQNYTGTSMGSYVSELIGRLQNTSGVTLSGGKTYSGSIMDFADSFTGDIASAVNRVQGMADSTSSIVSNLDSQRQSISSVSLDEEGINIIKYQQSYNASARVITAIDEMLNTLINSTGLAGS